MKKFKNKLQYLHLDFKREIIKIISIALGIILCGLVPAIILKSFLYIGIGIGVSLIAVVMLFADYDNRIDAIKRDNMDEFVNLFSFFRIYIKNGFIDNLILSISASIILFIVLINLFAKALVESSNKQFNTALVCYNEAVSKDPDNPFYYINRGALQSEIIDFISSIENNVQVLSLDNSATLKTRVQDPVKKNYDYGPARQDMKTAVALAPDFPYS